MNRLQKKCVFVTAAVHLLLLVILLVGPAFFTPRPKADDLTVLDVIPANLIDAPFNSGVANATPPPPEPPQPPSPPLPPQKVEPPAPVKPPQDKLPPTDLKPVEKPAKTDPRKPQISTQLVTRGAPKTAPNTSPNNAARAKAIRAALQKLKNDLSSGSVVDAPGNGSVAYASYDSAVKSAYYQTWMQILLDTVAKDGETVVARITIASDGTVLNANITTPSGDAKVDASVRQTLERVKEIAPFPEGATEKQRTYTINFNTTVAKHMLE